ncbi:MFS transporter [Streptomyces sp. SID13726]|uniref:MFS transporter n=1 Tax=Streptomyces sp. SID13726 TaxID=2706058 RepID=UPI0013BDCA69|nr:MFS transporter [Streptomyces sp. SID13726]NEB06038.1 MFS transporter [Streptomyces sp. SID13726]
MSASYALVLRIPHARRTFATALLGRLSYGVVPLSVMLAVNRASGSYAVAGAAMALFGATVVLLAPARAALIDRYGPRRALVPLLTAYVVLLALLTAAVWRPGASPVLLGILTALAGACVPPLGPTMRTVWSRLAQDDKALLQRAYSLDGVAEELLFVSGPLLVGVLVGVVAPTAGIVVGAALMVAGTTGFVRSPAVRAVPPAAPSSVRRDSGGRRVLRRIARPVGAAAAVGLALGVLDLLVVVFAERHHHGAASVAWVLAALSAGSAVGGLLNGSVNWSLPARTRLTLLTACLGAALVGAGLAPGLGTLALVMAGAGFFVSPAVTTAYLIADATVAPEARTRAGAWVNTAVNAGSTGGTAAAGVLAGRLPVAGCFAVTGAVVVVTAVLGMTKGARGRGALREEVAVV